MTYNQDFKRRSKNYCAEEENPRSESRKRASLRRKYVDEDHARHERSKSLVSVDSNKEKHEFTLQNKA